MEQIYSGFAIASARSRASKSNECPPRNEQNCLGTAMPEEVVVKPWSRLPSPPANTIAQVFPEAFIRPCIVLECALPTRSFRCRGLGLLVQRPHPIGEFVAVGAVLVRI